MIDKKIDWNQTKVAWASRGMIKVSKRLISSKESCTFTFTFVSLANIVSKVLITTVGRQYQNDSKCACEGKKLTRIKEFIE